MTATLTRLHITPFTPDLVQVVLGSSLTAIAQNTSFHTLDTYPEKSYGYVDLPSADAQRLVKKLNGAILRGQKMKLAEARPSKKRKIDVESGDGLLQNDGSSKQMKASVKENVIDGHELSPDRKVKRGWTEPKERKNMGKKSKSKKEEKVQAASKYTEKEELLFRTKIPDNKQDLVEKKKKNRKEKTDVIHEFEKNVTQPKFLRDDIPVGSNNNSYVDGQGWLDENGEMVEPEPASVKRCKKKPGGLAISVPTTPVKLKVVEAVGPSPRETSSLEEDTSTPEDRTTEKPEPVPSIEISQTVPPEDIPAAEVHPLEAIFKKPVIPSLEVQTGFSFAHNPDDIEEERTPEPVMPMTPHTAMDMRYRDTRSAAPTPDTAHPSRFSSFDDQLDNLRSLSREATAASQATHESEQSEFEKKFWEERGANNRAWKARRRQALKDERQKANKARRSGKI